MAPPHAGPLPVSVVIVARDAPDDLRRCLASVRGWTAQQVVVLNGPTEPSASAARDAGAEVHVADWLGYGPTKNAALRLARHPWVLSLDADEEVSPDLRTSISAFLDQPGPAAAARFARKVWFINRWIRHGDWYPDHVTRLFRTDAARWSDDAVHERLETRGPVTTLAGDLHHFSFPSVASHAVKSARYAELSTATGAASPAALPMLLRPGWRFFRSYILRGGFLDGVPGLIVAIGVAHATFLRYARRWEEGHRRPPPGPGGKG